LQGPAALFQAAFFKRDVPTWWTQQPALEFSQTRQAPWNTILRGVLAATGGTFLALTVGYITTHGLATGHRFLVFLATAPIAIPGIAKGRIQLRNRSRTIPAFPFAGTL
jgi:iron(III) transport system permease protein